MKIINQYVDIISPLRGDDLIRIETAARTCYKTEDKITEDSAKTLVRSLIKSGHEAMLEHGGFTAKFVCDRGISHQIVRHRMASFAQESTLINYEKKNGELTFIWPHIFGRGDNFDEMINRIPEAKIWWMAMCNVETSYMQLLEQGVTPKWARSVLPNSVKTEVIMTANFREWRHFFKLRSVGVSGNPHPQIRYLADALLTDANIEFPVIFEDIYALRFGPYDSSQ